MGVLSYVRSAAVLLAKTGDFLQSEAEATIETIDRNLFERYGDVQAFAFNPLARGGQEEVTQAANFYMRAYGIYDLMLVVDRDGTIIAANTVTADGKPLDTVFLIGKSVKGEEWFEKAVSGEIGAGATYYSDLTKDKWVADVYKTRGLALNFSAPIFDEHGKVVRVWSNRASWERIVSAITADMREELKAKGITTAEVQVISKTGLLLDDYDPEAVLSFNVADAGLEAAQAATQGKRGYTQEVHKRRHVMQVNGYAASKGALGFKGYNWGVLVRQDADEATAAARSLRNFLCLAGAIMVGLIGVMSVWIARSIVQPVGQTVRILEAVAAGDLTQQIKVSSQDEIGLMAAALNRATSSMREAIRSINHHAHSVASSSEELTSVSQQMAASAEETSAQAGTVSAASEQVSANIHTVAASGEEMGASIKEIAKNASEAAKVAAQAVTVAETTNTTVAKLGQSSVEIGQVVKVITSIAEQTNLLALNATIEAARAGEAGKGFAVVANEVKELAKQTAQATEDISQKIEAIQGDAQAAVEAIGQIGEIIHQINDIANTIASAVEEQSVTTSEIGRNVEEASKGSGEIAQNITGVAQAAQTTASGAAETQAAAQELARMAEELKHLVNQFHYETAAGAASDARTRGSIRVSSPRKGSEAAVVQI
jgi:methyl-accepting chemotaxis protein